MNITSSHAGSTSAAEINRSRFNKIVSILKSLKGFSFALLVSGGSFGFLDHKQVLQFK